MSLTALFIGAAIASGVSGAGLTAKAGFDQKEAKNINEDASSRMEESAQALERARIQCEESLEALGAIKLSVLDEDMMHFLESFKKIKNVDFKASEGLDELANLKVDSKEFEQLGEMTRFACDLAKGGAIGGIGGALAAFGAYSAATTFATASTGATIASLSGAAATNATLAFFGGGSLAAGGMGVAGGTAVLGGLVAGPALLVMGVITGAKAGKNLEEAKANAAIAEQTCAEFEAGVAQCRAVRRRTYLFYTLLVRLDVDFRKLVKAMDEIIEAKGCDYAFYDAESKKTIAACVSSAASIKAVLDTPILSEDGSLTAESEAIAGQA